MQSRRHAITAQTNSRGNQVTKTAQREIEELRTQLERHNYLYYVAAKPEISDLEFDKLLKKLEKLEAEHPEYDSPLSPTKKVGGAPIEGFQTVAHRLPMLSIDNVYDQDALREFDARVQRLLDGETPEYTLEYKIDGVALSVTYQNGVLTQALTRGNGQEGDDITENAKTIRGIPLRFQQSPKHPFPIPDVLEIRGEAYIANSDFAELRRLQEEAGLQVYANPRNTAAGALKLLDPRESAKRRVRFITHGVGYMEGAGFTSHLEYLSAVHSYGLPATPDVEAFHSIDAVLEHAQPMMERLHELDFEVDGLVVKLNQFAQRDALGNTSKSPRWLIAYKWERYEATTQIEKIDIQVGKTGALTPVAYMKPVEIAGTTVSRSSLHNRDEIERLDVREGDHVIVEKAGKIIPHIVRVEKEKRTGNEQPFEFPEACPICETPTVRDEGGVYVRCPNPNCPARLRESLRFFVSRQGMDIDGCGIKLIEQLLEANLVASFADLYRLKDHREKLLALERLGEKSVDKLLAGIEASRSQPLWRLLTALNIRHVGSSNARILADQFGTVDEISKQSVEDLSNVDEIGQVIAESVYEFFHSEFGTNIIQELGELGLNMGSPVANKPQAASPFAGKSIVVTGTLQNYTRDEIKELLHSLGAKASSSVSRKTDYLIAGENAGSKLDKANEFGVEVLSEQDFAKMHQSSQEE